MSDKTSQLWNTLSKAGVVAGPEPRLAEAGSPWYVKALLGFSGWLAALFLLGFIGVGLEFVMRSSTVSFVSGWVLIGGAFAILRMPKNEFYEHLGLAVSLAGQALVAMALFKVVKRNDELAWLLVALMEVPLALVMPNFVHRVFSSFLAAVAFAMTLHFMRVPYLFGGVVLLLAAYLWLNEFRFPRHLGKVRAIGYGLVLALVLLKSTELFGLDIMGLRFARERPELWVRPWMGEVVAGAATLFVVWQLLRRHGQALAGRFAVTALTGTLALCAVSMEAKGITAGMVIMLLGFAGGNRVLLGLGIASLLFYISSYYYLLDATLLAKAQTLLVTGLGLLALRWLMVRVMAGEKEAEHV